MQVDNSYSGSDFTFNNEEVTYNVFDLIDSYDELKTIVPEVLNDDRIKNISKSFYVVCTDKMGYEIILENFEAASYEVKTLFISKILPQICEISNTEHGSDLVFNIVLLSPHNVQTIINYLQYGLLYFGNFGSLLICNILQKVSLIYLDTLLLQLINHIDKLAVGEFGSKMILKLIEANLDVKYIGLIHGMVMKHFFVLCCNKYSYKIVKNWIQLYPEYLRNIVGLITRTWRSDQPSIITLTNDQHAKYVINVILKHIDSVPDLKKVLQQQIEDYDPHHAKHLKENADSISETKNVKVPIVKEIISLEGMNKDDRKHDVKMSRSKRRKENQREREAQITKPFHSQFVPEKKKEKENIENDNVIKISYDLSVNDEKDKKHSLSISLPVQLAFALTNEGVSKHNDSLIPDEDRKPLWDDMIDSTPYYGFYTIPEDNNDVCDEENPVKIIAARSILYFEPEDNDSKLLDEGMQEMYPNLDIYEDYDDRIDWIIHDYDIDEFFEKEWNEEEFFKQLDFESHLSSIGLSGDDVEIDWKMGDNCEVCINEKTIFYTEKHISGSNFMFGEIHANKDKWLVGKIFGVSKANGAIKMFQIKLPLNYNIIVVSTSEFLRPIIKYKQSEQLK